MYVAYKKWKEERPGTGCYETFKGHRSDSYNQPRVSKQEKHNGGSKQKPNGVPSTKRGNLSKFILRGHVDIDIKPNANIVRVFTSSTFTDTRHERNALMERVYPRLKEFCQGLGYEFQVVDMRWGIREEATNDHMTTDLCLQELRACKKLSTGPNFVTFLSHKYGYRPLSRVINADEFESLVSNIPDQQTKHLLYKWLKKDENRVPAAYVLQPISTHLPDYLNKEDQEAFQEAGDIWWKENKQMQEALAEAAKRTFTDEKRKLKYLRSVTEHEITEGILDDEESREHSMWFRRNITGINNQPKSKLLSRYTECLGPDKAIQEVKDLIETLKEKRLTPALDPSNILTYTVPWTNQAIDPVGCREHKTYIDELCQDFEHHLRRHIERGIQERQQSESGDPLLSEILQHTAFCQLKCKAFFGRTDTMKRIVSYITGTQRQPFVVHGKSGSGKTSIVAMAAKYAHTCLENPAVILRFIGTTPESSNIRPFLVSIIKQIKAVYKDISATPEELTALKEHLPEVLGQASISKPLVVLLDSLDQFDPEGGARQLAWLPRTLPNHVRLIVSTLPEEKYDCFPKLKAMFKEEDQFLEVPQLPASDVRGIVKNLLSVEQRTLTSHQMALVETTFKQCPLPLFLKLCFDEACLWTSYKPPGETALEATIREIINTRFSRLERSHGVVLVSHTLAYMTLSRSGLSEIELEDILSCDDEVLGDVYQFWEPPVRRLPPLLLVRVKSDLQQYLVERGADGIRVSYWYHRQFIEAAYDLYCKDNARRIAYHQATADYYLGKWANGVAKPYTDRDGHVGQKERFVASQPYRFENQYNKRKLMELPTHLIESDQLGSLKENVLCNLEWLSNKLLATSLRDILDDFDLARQKFPEDEDIALVAETLQLSRKALHNDPHQLPAQIVGRINKGAGDLLAQCRSCPYPALLCETPVLTPPGGALIHAMSYHTENINSIALSADGIYAVTCDDKGRIALWDIKQGRLINTLENEFNGVENLSFCCDDQCLIAWTEKTDVTELTLLKTSTLEIVTKIMDRDEDGTKSAQYNVYGPTKSMVATFTGKNMRLYKLDLHGCEEIDVIRFGLNSKIRRKLTYSEEITMAGHSRYIAVKHSKAGGEFFLFDSGLEVPKFTHRVEVFLPPESEDDDELEIEALAVTLDDTRVVLSNYMDNDIHIYNTATGQKVITHKGNKDDFCPRLWTLVDGRMMFSNRQNICVWNIETGERDYINLNLEINDVASQDLITMVTYSDDYLVRIWDLRRQREAPPADKDGNLKYDIRDMNICPFNKRYAVYEMKKTQKSTKEIENSLVVFDLVKKQSVRQTTWTKESFPIYELQFVNERLVILEKNRNLCLLDLETMKDTKYMQGNVPKYHTECGISSHTKDVVSLTRGRFGIKAYSLDSGHTKYLIHPEPHHWDCIPEYKNPEKRRLQGIKVFGRYAIAFEEETAYMFVFDLEEKRCDGVMHFDDVTFVSTSTCYVTDTCTVVMEISAERPASGKEPDEKDNVSYPALLNLQTKEIVHHFLDVDLFDKYVYSDQDDRYEQSLNCMTLYDLQTLVTSHYDNNVRSWDLIKGDLLMVFRGHISAPEVLLSCGNNRLLTSVGTSDDCSIRLWDMSTGKTIASIIFDEDMAARNSSKTRSGNKRRHSSRASSSRPNPVMDWADEVEVEEVNEMNKNTSPSRPESSEYHENASKERDAGEVKSKKKDEHKRMSKERDGQNDGSMERDVSSTEGSKERDSRKNMSDGNDIREEGSMERDHTHEPNWAEAGTDQQMLSRNDLEGSMEEMMEMLNEKSSRFAILTQQSEEKDEMIALLEEKVKNLEETNGNLKKKCNTLEFTARHDKTKLTRANKKIEEQTNIIVKNGEAIARLEQKNRDHLRHIGAMAEATTTPTSSVQVAPTVNKPQKEKVLFVSDTTYASIINYCNKEDVTWDWIMDEQINNISDMWHAIKNKSFRKSLSDYSAIVLCLGLDEVVKGKFGRKILTKAKTIVYKLSKMINCPIYICEIPPISTKCPATSINNHTIFNHHLVKWGKKITEGQIMVVKTPTDVSDLTTDAVVTSADDHTLLDHAAKEWAKNICEIIKLDKNGYENPTTELWSDNDMKFSDDDDDDNDDDEDDDNTRRGTQVHSKGADHVHMVEIDFDDRDYKNIEVSTIIPRRASPKLIGTGGKNIKKISETTDTFLKKVKGEEEGTEDEVLIKGTPIGIARALVSIKNVINEFKNEKEEGRRDICIFHQNGKCKKGDQCNFKHVDPAKHTRQPRGQRQMSPMSPVRSNVTKRQKRY